MQKAITLSTAMWPNASDKLITFYSFHYQATDYPSFFFFLPLWYFVHSPCIWLLSKHRFIPYALSFSGSHYHKIIEYNSKYPSQVGMDLQASSSQTPGFLPPLLPVSGSYLTSFLSLHWKKNKSINCTKIILFG